MEAVCPDAWLLEYANPLSTICWQSTDYTKVKMSGFATVVPHTAAKWLNISVNPSKKSPTG